MIVFFFKRNLAPRDCMIIFFRWIIFIPTVLLFMLYTLQDNKHMSPSVIIQTICFCFYNTSVESKGKLPGFNSIPVGRTDKSRLSGANLPFVLKLAFLLDVFLAEVCSVRVNVMDILSYIIAGKCYLTLDVNDSMRLTECIIRECDISILISEAE